MAGKPRKLGRPGKLTPELQESIVQGIKAGNYAEVSARNSGIAPTTFFRWMQQGEDRPGLYRKFRESIRNAEAFSEARAVAIVANGMLADPKHAEWYLERKHPNRWGRHERIEHTGAEGAPLTFTLTLDRKTDEDGA